MLKRSKKRINNNYYFSQLHRAKENFEPFKIFKLDLWFFQLTRTIITFKCRNKKNKLLFF